MNKNIHRALYALKNPLLKRIKGLTVSQLMLKNATDHPKQVALYHSPDNTYQHLTPMTWKIIHQQACQLATYLLSQHIVNSTVLIMARNRPEHHIADLACLYSNNVPASIYTTLTANQIAVILQKTKASHVIVDSSDMYQHAQSAARKCTHPISFICMDTPKRLYKNTTTWAEAMDCGKKSLPTYHQTILNHIRKSKPSDTVCMIFTSGTTGMPKGAILSHENVIFAAIGIQLVGTQHIKKVKLVSYLPLAHVFERVVGYYGWIYSRHTLLCTWSVLDLKAALVAFRPSLFVGVPRIYEKIEQSIFLKFSQPLFSYLLKIALKNAHIRNQCSQNNQPIPFSVHSKHRFFSWLFFNRIRKTIGLDQCQLCLSGSAPLDREIIDFFASLNLDIVEGYGLTENSAPATVSWNHDMILNMQRLFQTNRISFPINTICMYGRVGYPMPGTKIKICPKKNTLSIYGPHVFQGYLFDCRATKKALSDGWLNTGDIGTIHPNGEVEIIGRQKDLIVLSNGKNIAPRKIESAMSKHPLIAHCCLTGDNQAYLIAIICIRNDGGEIRYAKSHGLPYVNHQQFSQSSQVHDLIQSHVHNVNQQFCRPEQVKYFHITADIWSSESGHLTPTLKLKRTFIIEHYAQITQKIYQQHDPSLHRHH